MQAFLLNLRMTSNSAGDLVHRNGELLSTTLQELEPVMGILAKYSPELPCVIKGVLVQKDLAEDAVGGTNPGVTTFTQIQAPDPAYTYRRDLPQIGDTRGPNCFGLPEFSQGPPRVDQPFRTGTDPHAEDSPPSVSDPVGESQR